MAQQTDPRVAVLSIHPEYAHGILAGTKRVEFRRRAFGQPVTHVVVYATAPESSVLGYFTVAGVDIASPRELWKRHGGHGLISKEKFLNYFAGRAAGYAIRVGDVVRLANPQRLRAATGHETPPQSFAYVSPRKAQRLLAARDR
jgi:predicted transcriptional regulator